MRRSRPYRGKRIVDLTILVVAAVPAGLLGLAIAAAVRLTSRGPALFKQERAGMAGEPFVCLKFRTMVEGDNPLVPDASRITTLGRWLRRLSLDELPQLVNVARGEMSVVGPRPMLPFQAARCDERQEGRFAVRPGLTGWAQVNGRNAVSWPDRIESDLEYVEQQSVSLDLAILARTAGALVSGDGVDGHPADDPFVISPEPIDA